MTVLSGTGINDDLNGVERPVRFPVLSLNEQQAEVVHSLAKWKRLKLAELGIAPGRGIYTDMNALRPDEELDNLHSIYVDQWDWEKVIRPEDRNLDFLKRTVRRIYEAVKVTENKLYVEFPQLVPALPDDIYFIHAEELLQRYPTLSPKERENAVVREHKAVFIIGIGGKLSDGSIHDGRAADYDDWSTPNSDGYEGPQRRHPPVEPRPGERLRDFQHGHPRESGSDAAAAQGARAGSEEGPVLPPPAHRGRTPADHRRRYRPVPPVHVPLRKAHIGEIQSSIWPEAMREACHKAGIELA
jgi:Asparagine synthetase A